MVPCLRLFRVAQAAINVTLGSWDDASDIIVEGNQNSSDGVSQSLLLFFVNCFPDILVSLPFSLPSLSEYVEVRRTFAYRWFEPDPDITVRQMSTATLRWTVMHDLIAGSTVYKDFITGALSSVVDLVNGAVFGVSMYALPTLLSLALHNMLIATDLSLWTGLSYTG